MKRLLVLVMLVASVAAVGAQGQPQGGLGDMVKQARERTTARMAALQRTAEYKAYASTQEFQDYISALTEQRVLERLEMIANQPVAKPAAAKVEPAKPADAPKADEKK